MPTKYEKTKVFSIFIKGIGVAKVSGVDQFHAIEKAHTRFMSVQPDREKYAIV